MFKHKWYFPLAAAAVTALSVTGVSLADDHRSDASVSAKAQSSAGHDKTKRARALGGVNVKVVHQRFNLPADSYIDETATCPSNMSAVGGGFDGTADDAWKDFSFLDSAPNNSNGWTIRVHNAGDTNAYKVYAVVTCAS